MRTNRELLEWWVCECAKVCVWVDKKMNCKDPATKRTERRLIKTIFIVTFHQRFGMISSPHPRSLARSISSRLAYAKLLLSWTPIFRFLVRFHCSKACCMWMNVFAPIDTPTMLMCDVFSQFCSNEIHEFSSQRNESLYLIFHFKYL